MQTGLKLQVKHTRVILGVVRNDLFFIKVPVENFLKDNSILRTATPLKHFAVHIKEITVVPIC